MYIFEIFFQILIICLHFHTFQRFFFGIKFEKMCQSEFFKTSSLQILKSKNLGTYLVWGPLKVELDLKNPLDLLKVIWTFKTSIGLLNRNRARPATSSHHKSARHKLDTYRHVSVFYLMSYHQLNAFGLLI